MFDSDRNPELLPAEYYKAQLETLSKENTRLKKELEVLKRENLFLKVVNERGNIEEEYTD